MFYSEYCCCHIGAVLSISHPQSRRRERLWRRWVLRQLWRRLKAVGAGDPMRLDLGAWKSIFCGIHGPRSRWLLWPTDGSEWKPWEREDVLAFLMSSICVMCVVCNKAGFESVGMTKIHSVDGTESRLMETVYLTSPRP